MITDKKTILAALKLFKKQAEDKRIDAGYSGSHDDGGCCADLELAKAFEDGMNGNVPDFLRKNVVKMRRESDPEYKEYVRMREKFEE